MKKLAIVAGLVLLAVPVFAGEIVPLSSSERSRIEGEFIVTFKPGVDVAGAAEALAQAHGAEVVRQWTVIPGVLMRNLPDAAALAIVENPNVALVEPNEIVSIGPPVQTLDAVPPKGDQVNPPSWGLDRVDERDGISPESGITELIFTLDNNYHYDYTGTGVHAYIIDSGARMTHNDFGGRFSNGYDFIDNDDDPSDCHGHGTHVSATVGGTLYGVAKNVTLHAVRVLNCSGSGTYDQAISGIDWVTNNHVDPAVANMSLGGGFSQAVNDAVTNSIAAGVFYAVAAGNSNANACNYSPATTPNAMTVGATTSSDSRASYSNHGTCLDVFAPGSSITSAWHTSDDASNTIDGTSMASPHVAGGAVLVLDQYPSYTPAQVNQELINRATTGVVSNPGSGSPNRLLYTLDDSCIPVPEICDNGIDDDCDGYVDCDDSDCSTDPACQCVPVPEICDNGIDDDCDEAVDCDDPDCSTDPACQAGCPPSYQTWTGTATYVGQNLVTDPPFWGSGTLCNTQLTCDNGPSAADLDLYLDLCFEFFGCWWMTSAGSQSPDCTEEITDVCLSSYRWRWRVYVYSLPSGAQPFTLCTSES